MTARSRRKSKSASPDRAASSPRGRSPVAPYNSDMRTFNPPPQIDALIRRLADLAAGHEAYVIGGTVRDVLLGRAPRDIDLAFAGDALAWARGAAEELRARFVLLDDERDVARLVPPERDGPYIDVARIAGTVERDARRRDFTIDALAVPLGGSDVIDSCGGLPDLEARLVRMNGAGVLDGDPL